MDAATQPHTTSRNDCFCGCGQDVSEKANYRPGHDARHVSNLLALVAVDLRHLGYVQPDTTDAGIKGLPSQALKAKYLAAVERLTDRHNNRRTRSAKSEPAKQSPIVQEHPPIKVGRWEYPARSWFNADGKCLYVERNTKRDGSGEWVSAS